MSQPRDLVGYGCTPPEAKWPGGARIAVDTTLTLAEVRRRGVESLERRYLKEMLGIHRGRIKDTAKAAGISVRHLSNMMTRYGIRREEFRFLPVKKQK